MNSLGLSGLVFQGRRAFKTPHFLEGKVWSVEPVSTGQLVIQPSRKSFQHSRHQWDTVCAVSPSWIQAFVTRQMPKNALHKHSSKHDIFSTAPALCSASRLGTLCSPINAKAPSFLVGSAVRVGSDAAQNAIDSCRRGKCPIPSRPRAGTGSRTSGIWRAWDFFDMFWTLSSRTVTLQWT